MLHLDSMVKAHPSTAISWVAEKMYIKKNNRVRMVTLGGSPWSPNRVLTEYDRNNIKRPIRYCIGTSQVLRLPILGMNKESTIGAQRSLILKGQYTKLNTACSL